MIFIHVLTFKLFNEKQILKNHTLTGLGSRQLIQKTLFRLKMVYLFDGSKRPNYFLYHKAPPLKKRKLTCYFNQWKTEKQKKVFSFIVFKNACNRIKDLCKFFLFRLRMKGFWTVIFGLILVSTTCYCQVNFTPNWGKRSTVQGVEAGCKAPLESLMYVYKLLQSEAQKIIDCERLSSL